MVFLKGQYFCCCDECGSIEWVDRGFINALTRDGDTLDNDNPIKYNHILSLKKICTNCEKPLDTIKFSEVSKQMRIKIFFMEDEERINWVKGYWIIHELKDKNEKEKKK